MSADIVSDKEVILIAAIYHEQPYEEIKIQFDTGFYVLETAKELLRENYRSVNHRYRSTGSEPLNLSKFMKQDGDIDYWKFENYCNDILKEFSLVQKFKAVQHYNYQACECDDYRASRAREIVDTAISGLISQLDGYSEASWGIKD